MVTGKKAKHWAFTESPTVWPEDPRKPFTLALGWPCVNYF